MKTCLNYLYFSLSLIDASTPEGDRTANVGKSFYTLQSYVNDNWLDHLLVFASHLCPDQDLLLE